MKDQKEGSKGNLGFLSFIIKQWIANYYHDTNSGSRISLPRGRRLDGRTTQDLFRSESSPVVATRTLLATIIRKNRISPM
jgi:hypothetical protein